MAPAGPMYVSVLLLLGLAPAVCPLHCAFIHGAGVGAPPEQLQVKGDFRQYWGFVKDIVPCDTYSFMYANTVAWPWSSGRLATLACAAALGPTAADPSPRDGGVVRDAVVFTHSMGNLLFAFALQQGHCRLAPSAAWAAVSAPWRGSVAADHLLAFCNRSRPWSIEVKELSDLLHFCVGRNLSASNYALQTWSPGLGALADIGRQHVRAALCGRSPTGLRSMYSPLLEFVSRLMQVPVPDDGMVTLDSCQAGSPQHAVWERNSSSPFYLAEVNHADSTCRNGDSKKNQDAQMPCHWYRQVVLAHRQTMDSITV